MILFSDVPPGPSPSGNTLLYVVVGAAIGVVVALIFLAIRRKK